MKFPILFEKSQVLEKQVSWRFLYMKKASTEVVGFGFFAAVCLFVSKKQV